MVTTEYIEKHHIIPKCIGGNDKKENISQLTAKEHRLVHLLLPKMVGDINHRKKLWYAAWMILRTKNQYQPRNISKGTFYQIAKIKVAEQMSILHKGKIVSLETRKKMSEARKGKTLSEETKKKISEARSRYRKIKF
jgi:hypothetical protein